MRSTLEACQTFQGDPLGYPASEWTLTVLPPKERSNHHVSSAGNPQSDAKQFDRAAPLRARVDPDRALGLNQSFHYPDAHHHCAFFVQTVEPETHSA